VRSVVLAVALWFAGCFTPSIPIPPPNPEAMTFSVDLTLGQATFAYGADESYVDATVYVYNRTQGRGVIDTARPDGSVGPTAPFPAAVGDQIQVTFEADTEVASVCVLLREGIPNALCP
jgi:hypothetical protein